MKIFAVQSKSTPDDAGYHDWGFLIDNYVPGVFTNGNVSATAGILWRGVMSAQPNPNMFRILKDNLTENLIYAQMSQMTQANRSWCAKCNRTYCRNIRTTGLTSKDPRIDCSLYARLAPNNPGEGYSGRFISNHPKYGRCILMNEGNQLPSIQPSSAHDGAFYCTEIFIHRGFAADWEGSAGCLTIPPDDVFDFFSFFIEGEIIRLELFDYSKRVEPIFPPL